MDDGYPDLAADACFGPAGLMVLEADFTEHLLGASRLVADGYPWCECRWGGSDMAKPKGGGVGVLIVLGLIAIGYSNAGEGSGTPARAGQVDTESSTCDATLVVDGAVVPADMDPPDGTATTSCQMQIGDGGEAAVTALQRSLAECHGQAVTVDGEYGPETAAGVSAVQAQGGVTVDGEYGPATLGVTRWPVEDPGSAAGAECVAPGSQPGLAADVADPVLPATG
jgi:hypothetical protein